METRARVSVLGDYGSVACRLADWNALSAKADVRFFDDVRDRLSCRPDVVDSKIICLTRERTPLPRDQLAQFAKLRTIITTGRITANLDQRAAAARDIRIVRTTPPAAAAGAVDPAELTIALILDLARGVSAQVRSLRGGRWQEGPGRSVRGMTLGIVGFGRVGRAVVPPARALGMQVQTFSAHLSSADAHAAGVTLAGRDELFATSDVVSLHLPANATTARSIGRREIALMRPRSFLINTSRACILDQDALIDALKAGAIAGAALDVFDEEPLPRDSVLLRVPRLLLTPHLGYATERSLRTLYAGVIAALAEHLDGYAAGYVT